MEALITRSQPMEATTRSMRWLGSIPTAECISSTFGESRLQQTHGSKPFAISFSSGNQLPGLRRRRRSPQASVLTSIAASGSERRLFIASNFRPRGDKAVRGPVHSRQDGTAGTLRADQCILVSGVQIRAPRLSCGQARRSSRCAWTYRPVAGPDDSRPSPEEACAAQA